MRLIIDLRGVRHEVELRHHADSATLADLVASVAGVRPAPGAQLWVDDRAHPGDRRLVDLTLLEGSQVAEVRRDRPRPLRGWSLTYSGRIDAGRNVPLLPGRPLLVGRSDHADPPARSTTRTRFPNWS